MREILKPDSQIAVIAHVKNSSTAIEREKGLREGLGEEQGKIADVVFCDSNYDKAYQLMLGVLEKHPDVDVVVGLNEYSAVGAARAIVDKGLAGEISLDVYKRQPLHDTGPFVPACDTFACNRRLRLRDGKLYLDR